MVTADGAPFCEMATVYVRVLFLQSLRAGAFFSRVAVGKVEKSPYGPRAPEFGP